VAGIPPGLLELIGEEIDRRFQSAKDKRWAQLEKQYGDLHELSQQADPPLPQEPVSEQYPELTEQLMERAEALLNKFGLRSTPEAATLLHEKDNLEGLGGYLELIDKVIDLTLKEVENTSPPAPSPAGVIAPSGGSAANPDLAESYRQRRKKIRPGDVNALTALKREFREKGLNIF
jgi:hypothetical protein